MFEPCATSGQALCGIDQRLPGMLWASVLRAPVQGEVPTSGDDTAARAVAGVKNVVRLPYGMAMVADSFFTAQTARDQLKVVWNRNSKARVLYTDQMRVGYTKFAIETLIDEVARGVKANPLAYRMDLLQKHPRGQAVLKAVGEMSQWGKAKLPKGHALGLAFSDAWNTYCGMVVQVSLDQGHLKVHKVWSAVDCGHALQPQNIQAQIEGSVIFGLSAALHERMVSGPVNPCKPI